MVCAASEQFADGEDEDDGELDALGDALALADADAEADGLADALADGLALAFGVTVIVVTPFWTVAVTRAPVVPTRKMAATAPLLALSNSSRSFSSM